MFGLFDKKLKVEVVETPYKLRTLRARVETDTTYDIVIFKEKLHTFSPKAANFELACVDPTVEKVQHNLLHFLNTDEGYPNFIFEDQLGKSVSIRRADIKRIEILSIEENEEVILKEFKFE